MNSKFAFLFAGALVVGGIFVMLKARDSGEGDEVLGSQREERVSGSGKERRVLAPGEKALRFLQSVPDWDVNAATSFAEIQARTGDLSIEQIEALLAEHSSHEGLSGWLRSALWAELGRRNDRSAFDRLLENATQAQRGEGVFARDQAIFAYLRGRVDQLTGFDESLDSIVDDFNKLSLQASSLLWQTGAAAGLASRLARLDHEAAWEFLQSNELSESASAADFAMIPGAETSASVGFFRGLSSEDLVGSYFEKWESTLDLPEVRKSYEAYRRAMNSGFSGVVPIPDEEVIFSAALASMARFNPEEALGLLAEHELDPDNPDYNRIHGMWRALAETYPERALEIFSEEKYLDPRRANIGWLLSQDYSAVPDAITETAQPSHQTQILQNVISSAGSNHVNDFFPTPEGPNRLPNFQQRHDFLEEAINRGTFGEKQKESLVESLKSEFKGKLGTE